MRCHSPYKTGRPQRSLISLSSLSPSLPHPTSPTLLQPHGPPSSLGSLLLFLRVSCLLEALLFSLPGVATLPVTLACHSHLHSNIALVCLPAPERQFPEAEADPEHPEHSLAYSGARSVFVE